MKGAAKQTDAAGVLDQLRAAAESTRCGPPCFTCRAEWREYAETLLRERVAFGTLSAAMKKVLGVDISEGALRNHAIKCMRLDPRTRNPING